MVKAPDAHPVDGSFSFNIDAPPPETVIVLDSPSELWATEWGRTLIVKTLFVGAAVAADGHNHKVLIPRLQRTPEDPILAQRLRVIVTGEAAALMAAFVATALLMGGASS